MILRFFSSCYFHQVLNHYASRDLLISHAFEFILVDFECSFQVSFQLLLYLSLAIINSVVSDWPEIADSLEFTEYTRSLSPIMSGRAECPRSLSGMKLKIAAD